MLRSGDLIVMVTDGVTEAMDFQGETFGRERLLSSVRRHRRLDAQQLAGQILWDVRRFVGLAEQSDDITIVVVRAS
jgi:sigma-B regulation protein RsbU (phosphoserine phosphatase)